MKGGFRGFGSLGGCFRGLCKVTVVSRGHASMLRTALRDSHKPFCLSKGQYPRERKENGKMEVQVSPVWEVGVEGDSASL